MCCWKTAETKLSESWEGSPSLHWICSILIVFGNVTSPAWCGVNFERTPCQLCPEGRVRWIEEPSEAVFPTTLMPPGLSCSNPLEAWRLSWRWTTGDAINSVVSAAAAALWADHKFEGWGPHITEATTATVSAYWRIFIQMSLLWSRNATFPRN